jgi:hypothetical protein
MIDSLGKMEHLIMVTFLILFGNREYLTMVRFINQLGQVVNSLMVFLVIMNLILLIITFMVVHLVMVLL